MCFRVVRVVRGMSERRYLVHASRQPDGRVMLRYADGKSYICEESQLKLALHVNVADMSEKRGLLAVVERDLDELAQHLPPGSSEAGTLSHISSHISSCVSSCVSSRPAHVLLQELQQLQDAAKAVKMNDASVYGRENRVHVNRKEPDMYAAEAFDEFRSFSLLSPDPRYSSMLENISGYIESSQCYMPTKRIAKAPSLVGMDLIFLTRQSMTEAAP